MDNKKIKVRRTVNINQTVRYKLTDRGKQILQEEADTLNKEIPHINWAVAQPDSDGYYTNQLWMAMRTFGPELGMSLASPFVDCKILIDMEVDEKDKCEGCSFKAANRCKYDCPRLDIGGENEDSKIR